MSRKIAIDFGTTNSVIAEWDSQQVIPSLVYIGEDGTETVGQAVRDAGYDLREDNRLFRNFKRGIVAFPAPAPRLLDDKRWSQEEIGQVFINSLLEPYDLDEIDQVVLTAPVAAFESYLEWLSKAVHLSADKIRVVDESTAAALGYAVKEPGALVLVVDFGGGTLDLSLVQLPESNEKAGGILSFLRRNSTGQRSARVVAKTGQIMGGGDIDQWMLAEVLRRCDLTPADLGNHYAPLLTECERAKIELTEAEHTHVAFELGEMSYHIPFTRLELENLMAENGFFTMLRRAIDRVMVSARNRGVFKEDIDHVLLVGGTSLIPSVQNALQDYFVGTPVRSDKPFTAVAEGALMLAAGYGLDDYLVHSYGLRYLDDEGQHQYEEVIPMNSSYPTEVVEVLLEVAHSGQSAVEFVIGEIDMEAVSMIEVEYENGQAVFVAKADQQAQQIVPLNEGTTLRVPLKPAGVLGEDRLKAAFHVDAQRQLRVTVTDVQNRKTLLKNEVLVALH